MKELNSSSRNKEVEIGIQFDHSCNGRIFEHIGHLEWVNIAQFGKQNICKLDFDISRLRVAI